MNLTIAGVAFVGVVLGASVTERQSSDASTYDAARSLGEAGVTDVATFYIPRQHIDLVGSDMPDDRAKILALIKSGKIQKGYHVASVDQKGILGLTGDLRDIVTAKSGLRVSGANKGNVDMPLGFVVAWDRSPVSISIDVSYGEIGRKTRVGTLKLPTYPNASIKGQRGFVFDRPAILMMGLPEESSRRGLVAVAVVSPSRNNGSDGLSNGEVVGEINARPVSSRL